MNDDWLEEWGLLLAVVVCAAWAALNLTGGLN